MNIKEKMHSGELYYPGDEALMKEQLAYLDKLYDFNMTRPTEQEKQALPHPLPPQAAMPVQSLHL